MYFMLYIELDNFVNIHQTMLIILIIAPFSLGFLVPRHATKLIVHSLSSSREVAMKVIDTVQYFRFCTDT